MPKHNASLKHASWFLTVALGALALALPEPARADVPPDGLEECDGLEAGDPCTVESADADKEGVCKASTCSRLDYANWDRDASAGPPSKEYACTLCEVSTETPVDEPEPTPAPTPDPAKGDPVDPNGKGSKTGNASDDAGKGSGDSGCSVSLGSAARGVGPWLLAAGFAMLVSRRRKS